jgi:maleate cis-trans isomerase
MWILYALATHSVYTADMAKRKLASRRKPVHNVTLDASLVAAMRHIGKQQMPPITALSRLLEEAMADYIVKHGPKGKGDK